MPYLNGSYVPFEIPGVTTSTPSVPLAQAASTFTDEQQKFRNAQANAASAAAANSTKAQPAVKHEVVRGETVSGIAAANNMTTKELLALNPQLTSNPKYDGGRTIFAGTKIITSPAVKAPAPTKTAPTTTTPTTTTPTTTTPTTTEPTTTEPTTTTPTTTTPTTTEPTTIEPTVTNIDNAALNSVLDQIAALTRQMADMQSAAAAEAAKPKVVGVRTVRKTGGVVETVQVMSDGTDGKVVDTYKDFGAKDSVMKMFENTGLGAAFIKSLTDSIDKVYDENIMPTDEQILNSIYSSDAYKTRFAANETIKKRMAEGKGMPGDRLLSPREYIAAEAGYREILQNAGLPVGFYDTQDDFTKLIGNAISVGELTERVNIAQNALNNADANIVNALKEYYGMTTGDLTAYLLDKDKAFNVINSRYQYTTEEAKKMYGAAEIGGAAGRAGMGASKAFAEEIFTAGKGSMAEQTFQTAARQQTDYSRLLGLYGETAGQEDLARESLGLAGGAEVGIKTRKLASKERAKFATRSAIDKTSLGRATADDV
jgi:LysM repeat protein